MPRCWRETDGAFGAAVDPALLTRLNLKTGDRITIGNAAIELRAALTNEPDKLAGGLRPRPARADERGGAARHRAAAARQSGALAIPAAVCLPDIERRAPSRRPKSRRKRDFPDAGWEIRTRNKASPQLERNVERFSQFLTLVGLTTLLVGGVGVANAVASHLARKRDVIATMKALGATGGGVFADLLHARSSLVALFATLHRRRAGRRFAVCRSRRPSARSFRCRLLRRCIRHVLALAIVYGLLTALAFALWPLGRAHDVSGVGAVPRPGRRASAAGRGGVISIATAPIVARSCGAGDR